MAYSQIGSQFLKILVSESPCKYGSLVHPSGKIDGTLLREKKKCFHTVQCYGPSTSALLTGGESGYGGKQQVADEVGYYFVREYGWRVRRLEEKMHEMRRAAQVQAEAFHVPLPLFNHLFFHFFQAEVLSGLLYKLRNSPPNRYACLVAVSSIDECCDESRQNIVGVVDATILRDEAVLHHVQGADEYVYLSGIAVRNNYRRQKVGTVLLKACEALSFVWGFEFLALRAYEDDWGARTLYANAGYKVVSRDPVWVTTWIGRRRRVLMVKRANLHPNSDHE
ncbi:GCN5-related N-acetyltransferase 10, chloroplastic [Malania oleifera]|uniref:GCN5-related N-acetyltransferase 10, chloroplastic n=1 Tax=Malania oleifera TaxID=397392 RepID=UPI0025ADDDDB|nr:GCN5-related N-acetyltransferase 10, chloroplastic [Malania oleifera]